MRTSGNEVGMIGCELRFNGDEVVSAFWNLILALITIVITKFKGCQCYSLYTYITQIHCIKIAYVKRHQ